MCGIIGYTGRQQALPILMAGLGQLEYRGYDSAGVALQRSSRLSVYRCQGRVDDLARHLPARVSARAGIAHTRWATHGEPSDTNAHPHTDTSGRIALVHNGIIDNAATLRTRLEADGVAITSDTDSELLAHLIAQQPDGPLIDRVRATLRQVTGTWGLLVVDSQSPGEIVAARNGSPLILGIGAGEMFAASDAAALVRHTRQVVYLDDGELATVTASGFEVSTLDARTTSKTTDNIETEAASFELGDHTHFMHKEICEQPEVVQRTLRGRLDRRFATARLDGLNLDAPALLGFRRIQILGCGSALIAGQLGARLIERMARLPCHAESAAEFRYRNPIIEADTLFLAVSQSGETFDTLSAVHEIQRRGGTVRGIVNVVGSSIARACDGGIYLHAGPEVAVVSTKTFMATLVNMLLLGLHLGRMRDLSPAEGNRLIDGLEALPDCLAQMLANEPDWARVAAKYARFDHAYFIGRNEGFALAAEGALKLKEVSYIHAEAYPAAELKHGPLALVSPDTPTVALLPEDELFERNIGSLEEIRARRGPLLVISQRDTLPVKVDDHITVPTSHPWLASLLMLLPLQLLAYHAALARNCDVDRPRNLAKSVTVE